VSHSGLLALLPGRRPPRYRQPVRISSRQGSRPTWRVWRGQRRV